MRYQRADVSGRSYFFTVNLAERKRSFVVDDVEVLRKVMRTVKLAHPFLIDAMGILSDHLHALWTLPACDCDYPTRWMLIKAGFPRRIPNGERRSESRAAKGKRGIWQRRYWERLIRGDRDFGRHVDYVHYNPVKRNHVKEVVDWSYSGFHRYVRQGLLRADGGGDAGFDGAGGFGEPA